MSDNYHFHRECVYYEGCKVTEEKQGRRTLYRIKCPVDRNKPTKGTLYSSLSDFENIKVFCVGFVPKQYTLFDLLNGGGEE